MADKNTGAGADPQLEDSAGSEPGEPETSTAEKVTGRLEAALAEIETLKDQALRGQAEAENARRRASKDVENAHKYALEKFAGELLPVVDSLEKAVESVADDATAEPVAEGVKLSLKLFLDVLEKAGVTRIDPVGEPFDPQHHEAMAMVEYPDAEPNSVIEVMQKGYALNERLIRAAMVVVSKAPAGTAGVDQSA